MYMELGRVQVQVTVASPDGKQRDDRREPERGHPLQRAYERDRRRRAVEADRMRWEARTFLSGPVRRA